MSFPLSATLKRIALYFKGTRLSNPEDLAVFFAQRSGRIAGRIVMGFSQKRLGKKHVAWVRNEDYSRDLVKAQIRIHARIICDLYGLSLSLSAFYGEKKKAFLKALLARVHADYITTSPPQFGFEYDLNDGDWVEKKSGLREVALRAGREIYAALPLTENMSSDNVEIFQGQIRLHYANLVSELEKRIADDFDWGD